MGLLSKPVCKLCSLGTKVGLQSDFKVIMGDLVRPCLKKFKEKMKKGWGYSHNSVLECAGAGAAVLPVTKAEYGCVSLFLESESLICSMKCGLKNHLWLWC